MSKSVALLLALVVALLSSPRASWAQPEKDVSGSKDHPLLTRMPGSLITSYDQKDFDSVDMTAYLTGPDAGWEGRTTRLRYVTADGKRHTAIFKEQK